MNIIFSSLVALLGAQVSFFTLAQTSADDVTPLQLKLMQTRKFNKPPLDVMLAMKTHCEDAGAVATGKRPTFDGEGKPTEGPAYIVCTFPSKIKYSFFGGLKNEAKVSQYRGDAVSFDKNSIVLRIRIIGDPIKREQSKNPEEYSALFKAIGDAIFIESIPIEASEQK